MSTYRRFREILSDEPVDVAAIALLGAIVRNPVASARIVEVEAYHSTNDPGSHAWRGPTPRTQVMFGPPGRAFVYFTYGSHWMLNVVARPEGEAAALLIRAAEPIHGIETMRTRRPKAKHERELLSGPGRLAAAFGIDGRFNSSDLLQPEAELEIVPGIEPRSILHGVRVGLSPGRGEHTKWRFVDADKLEWCSRPIRTLTPLPRPRSA